MPTASSSDFGVDDIQVLNGRYGPYITDKQRNARIPKERDPKTLTLEECRALLAAAPLRPARGRFGRRGAAAKTAKAAPAKGKAAAEGAPGKGQGPTQSQGEGEGEGQVQGQSQRWQRHRGGQPRPRPANPPAPRSLPQRRVQYGPRISIWAARNRFITGCKPS